MKKIFILPFLLVILSTWGFADGNDTLRNRLTLVLDRASDFVKSLPHNVAGKPSSFYYEDMTIDQLAKYSVYSKWISVVSDYISGVFSYEKNYYKTMSDTWFHNYNSTLEYVSNNKTGKENERFVELYDEYMLKLNNGSSRL